MDEKKFLENFAKILGSGAQEELDKIEQKRLREEKLLKSFGAALSKTADFEVKIEEEIPKPRQVKLPANFIKKTATPKIVIESPLVDVVSFIEPVEETIEEKIAVTADSTGIANTDLSDFVSQATSFTTKYEKGKKKASGEETEQREIDKINNTLRKEIELIKKSISEFHRLLHLQAMKLAWGGGGSSGGGEVWLKKLDDVDYQSLKNASDGQVLLYDGTLKKWVASDNYGGGTGGGDGDAIGPRGYRGSQGIHGFTGSGGLHGFSGSKGNTGFAGSVGFGIDGFTGSVGVGYAGSVGIGYAGSGGAGYTGSKGDASTSRIINYNYVGDGTANTFTIEGGYIANSVVVFLNGVKQVVGYDVFIDSGSTVNFTDPPPADFIVDVFGYQANSIIGEGGSGGGYGYTGSSGAAADKGYVGSQGDLGFTGSIGPQGFRGLFGFTGSEGVGYVGSHGLQGEKGDLGPQGEQGEQGPVGLQGEPGPVGNDGTRGAKGYTGSASTVVGYSGSIGPIGFVGSLGNLGYTGSKGAGYVGSRGAIGFDGPQGEIGYSGSQGVPGEYAALGYDGSQGELGYTGSIGYTGSTSDRLISNGYEVILATTGQLNLPGADNNTDFNARIQSVANVDIVANTAIWTFDTNSVFTLPDHGKIIFNSADPEQYIEGTQGFHIHASDGISIEVGANTWNFINDGQLTVPGNIIPQANLAYSLGNTTNRFESLWVGSNSVTFTDQVAGKQDQTLTVANGVFYITDSLNTKQQSNAGFRVGNFLLQNNYISLTNSSATFYIGSEVATANLVIGRNTVLASGKTLTFGDNTTQNTAYIPNIRTPRIISGITNTITIDFSTDTTIHLHTNAGTVTANLINFTAGKQVDVIIYNNIGGTQQYNHGLSTGNRAVGGQSFFLCSHPTMWVTYICEDNTETNCFVKAAV